ncbi:MAG: general secretion pathway protein GspK [Planctomycetes bacterium]|nr:general secretion pathway protein GspK [Planctomycetota bacterium]
MILSLMAWTFLQAMRVEVSIAKGNDAQIRALEAAKSGVDYAVAQLANDNTGFDGANDVWRDNAGLFQSHPMTDGDLTMAEFTCFYPNPNESGTTNYGCWDENGKVNINYLPKDVLQKLPRMNEDLAEALLDWMDADDKPRAKGAEDDYYQQLDPPYACKNQPIETIEEMLFVKGFDWVVLYGEDTNFNGTLDSAENDGDVSFPPDNQDGVLDYGLAHFVTVYSYDPNTTGTGAKRTNVNSAPDSELKSAVGKLVTSAQMDELLKRRKTAPLTSVGDLLDIKGWTEEAARKVMDLLTVHDNEYVPGVININTAPREVLKALPDIDEATANKMIEFRTTTEENLSDIGWVLRVIGKNKFKRIANFISVRSSQFMIQSVGRIPGSPVFTRLKVVVDRASKPWKVLYWKDISDLGVPYVEAAPDTER